MFSSERVLKFFQLLGATGFASAYCRHHDVLYTRTNFATACTRSSTVGKRIVLISTRIWPLQTLAEPVAPKFQNMFSTGLPQNSTHRFTSRSSSSSTDFSRSQRRCWSADWYRITRTRLNRHAQIAGVDDVERFLACLHDAGHRSIARLV